MSCTSGSAASVCTECGSTGLAQQAPTTIPPAYEGLASCLRRYCDYGEFRDAFMRLIENSDDYWKFVDYAVNEWMHSREISWGKLAQGARYRTELVNCIRGFLGITDDPMTHDLWQLCEDAISDKITPFYKKPAEIVVYIVERIPSSLEKMLFTYERWGGLPPEELERMRITRALERGESVPTDVLMRYTDLIASFGIQHD